MVFIIHVVLFVRRKKAKDNSETDFLLTMVTAVECTTVYNSHKEENRLSIILKTRYVVPFIIEPYI